MIKKSILIGLTSCLFVACSGTKGLADGSESKEKGLKEGVSGTSFSGKEEEAIPVLWHQTSAEYKALCYQAYNVARIYLDDFLKLNVGEEKYSSIIIDIDETILDNSRYNAFLTLNNKEHSEELWNEWVEKSVASTIPGAREFLQYAFGRGIKIFFISNRSAATKEYTMMNFVENEIPFQERGIMLSPAPGSSKIERRKAIEGSSQVILYIGDNLADFSSVYEMDKSLESRDRATHTLKNEFGTRYILLPNIMYGDWRNSLKKDGDNALQHLKTY